MESEGAEVMPKWSKPRTSPISQAYSIPPRLCSLPQTTLCSSPPSCFPFCFSLPSLLVPIPLYFSLMLSRPFLLPLHPFSLPLALLPLAVPWIGVSRSVFFHLLYISPGIKSMSPGRSTSWTQLFMASSKRGKRSKSGSSTLTIGDDDVSGLT